MDGPLKAGRCQTGEQLVKAEEFGVQLEDNVPNQMIPVANVQEYLSLATLDVAFEHQRCVALGPFGNLGQRQDRS